MGHTMEGIAKLSIEDTSGGDIIEDTSAKVAPGPQAPISQHCFSAEALDTTVYFQVTRALKLLTRLSSFG